MKRLFDDLADLDEAGGMTAAADQEFWSEAKLKQSVYRVNLSRRMLKTQIDRIQDDNGLG